MIWTITYYNATVQAEIDAWPVGIRAYYARITERIEQHGPNPGMPFTRAMGDGLFEIRAKGREGIGRAFFCTFVGQQLIVLHCIIKKSEKTPSRDLALARKRMKEVNP